MPDYPDPNATLTKIPIARDRYGSYSYDTEGEEERHDCHFREIVNIIRTDNREEKQSDALAYFPPDAGVAYGDVFRTDELKFFRVIKRIPARRIGETPVVFIKVYFEAEKEYLS